MTFLQRTAHACLAACVLLSLSVQAASDAGRGLKPITLTIPGESRPVALYGESHALVIGASDYNNGWPKLPGVKADVEAVAKALAKQGFEVTRVMNPSRNELDRAINDFVSDHGQKPDSRLLIYFAGHGHTLKPSPERQLGYLVPVDAPLAEPNVGRFKGRALSMEAIENYAKQIESKHALFVFDSCFSGSFFKMRAAPEVIALKTTLPVRQFITSGGADQQVPDISVFRKEFVAALEGEADQNRDGYVTGSELGSFLEDKVTNYSRQTQIPQYGKIQDRNLDKGDFVFALNRPQEALPAKCDDRDTDRTYWESIKSSDNRSNFQAYLEDCPNGAYVRLARIRLAEPDTPVVTVPPKVVVADTAAVEAEAERQRQAREAERVAEARRQTEAAAQRAAQAAEAQRAALEAETRRLAEEARQREAAAPKPGRSPEDAAALARKYPHGTVIKDCPECPEMVVLAAGNYEMGNYYEKHTVQVPSFAIGKTEVTQGQWRAVMGSNPSGFKACGDDCPVQMVNWDDAQAYVKKLSEKTGHTYRLPSEAEWEYACRAGGKHEYCGSDDADAVAWHRENSNLVKKGGWFSKDEYGDGKTQPVARKQANAWGLYDMSGNVWEWVEDCYHASYANAPTDGSAWTGGECKSRVQRGGSWGDYPLIARAALRYGFVPSIRVDFLGFRAARTLTP